MPTVDIEFQKLIMPLTEDEFNQLEKNIVEDGEVYEPLVLWNDVIIDGHNRWRIIQSHPEIPYHTLNKNFDDREDAIKWMCSKQLGRRNLTEFQKTILLGEIYQSRIRKDNSEQARGKNGAFIRRNQIGNDGRTGRVVADEQGVSHRAVERAGEILRGIQKAEEVSPNIREKIVTGELTPRKQDIAKLRHMEGEELKEAVRDIEAGRKILPSHKHTPCATQMKHSSEYNIDDFREELRGKVVQLDNSLDMTCRLTHSAMLETQEGKDALSDALLEIVGVVQKYKELC